MRRLAAARQGTGAVAGEKPGCCVIKRRHQAIRASQDAAWFKSLVAQKAGERQEDAVRTPGAEIDEQRSRLKY